MAFIFDSEDEFEQAYDEERDARPSTPDIDWAPEGEPKDEIPDDLPPPPPEYPVFEGRAKKLRRFDAMMQEACCGKKGCGCKELDEGLLDGIVSAVKKIGGKGIEAFASKLADQLDDKVTAEDIAEALNAMVGEVNESEQQIEEYEEYEESEDIDESWRDDKTADDELHDEIADMFADYSGIPPPDKDYGPGEGSHFTHDDRALGALSRLRTRRGSRKLGSKGVEGASNSAKDVGYAKGLGDFSSLPASDDDQISMDQGADPDYVDDDGVEIGESLTAPEPPMDERIDVEAELDKAKNKPLDESFVQASLVTLARIDV